MSTYTIVTGANGEIGHSLLEKLHAAGRTIIAIDLNPLHEHHAAMCTHVFSGHMGDVTNHELYNSLEQFDLDEVYHLAALLSTSAERNPELAQKVNVGGTLNLLELARKTGKRMQRPVKFLFPSTIAIYGFPSLTEKNRAGAVTEDEYTLGRTMYGINKLYCEQLGRYYDELYMRLAPTKEHGWVDFRGVRFPGLISAFTVPTGGTSDYAPEMLHAAAQGKSYSCFVREDAQIPFMAMPDGVDALMNLAAAPKENLTRHIYNIAAFAPTAAQIAGQVKSLFPDADITFAPDVNRQAIVDSWCADVNDNAARNDWGWNANYGFEECFRDYLAPNIKQRYA
ncbi:MAG: NAD-dependent epimerase/dehydratase family protein [Candidatus Kapabacteria bacterium]|nr:NAD-dependent epimerase/dehydratase family protein [Candidatus Kapabacteria bacterium]